jgi:pyridoxal phosphate enzyme (YggS family)
MTTIVDRLHAVRARIQAACLASGRDPSQVKLLAVSKTFDADAVRQVLACGQVDFGENYIQEAVDKIQALEHSLHPHRPIWHCIGPVQSNKTRLVATHFDWVHTVDRLKTAQRLSEQRPPHLAPLQVCVQINIDGGLSKSGAQPHEALALAQAVAQLPRLRLRGLMTLPDPTSDVARTLAIHQRARALYEQLRAHGLPLDTLSMGMSADLEAAIQAGSTLVRVGSAIFGART